MKPCWITLNVCNMERSIEFYNGILGLPVMFRRDVGPMSMVFLGRKDEMLIELLCGEGMPPVEAIGVSVGFKVDDLDKIYTHIKESGVEIFKELISSMPGIRFFFVKDPDGFLVQFVEEK